MQSTLTPHVKRESDVAVHIIAVLTGCELTALRGSSPRPGVHHPGCGLRLWSDYCKSTQGGYCVNNHMNTNT